MCVGLLICFVYVCKHRVCTIAKHTSHAITYASHTHHISITYVSYLTFTSHLYSYHTYIHIIPVGKFYTLTTGSNERRWDKMRDKLNTIVKSFEVYPRFNS